MLPCSSISSKYGHFRLRKYINKTNKQKKPQDGGAFRLTNQLDFVHQILYNYIYIDITQVLLYSKIHDCSHNCLFYVFARQTDQRGFLQSVFVIAFIVIFLVCISACFMYLKGKRTERDFTQHVYCSSWKLDLQIYSLKKDHIHCSLIRCHGSLNECTGASWHQRP